MSWQHRAHLAGHRVDDHDVAERAADADGPTVRCHRVVPRTVAALVELRHDRRRTDDATCLEIDEQDLRLADAGVFDDEDRSPAVRSHRDRSAHVPERDRLSGDRCEGRRVEHDQRLGNSRRASGSVAVDANARTWRPSGVKTALAPAGKNENSRPLPSLSASEAPVAVSQTRSTPALVDGHVAVAVGRERPELAILHRRRRTEGARGDIADLEGTTSAEGYATYRPPGPMIMSTELPGNAGPAVTAGDASCTSVFARCRSQAKMARSSPADHSVFPSGLKASALTPAP